MHNTPPLAMPELGSCASTGRAWRLWAASHSQAERLTSARPATASDARVSRLQSRQFHRQEALCTGKGAAARRERAVEAGWLELLISACSAALEGGEGGKGGGGGGGGGSGGGSGGGGWGEDGGVEGGVERAPAVGMARAALRSITRDSMQLQQAALDAGALRQWLL